MKDRNGQNRRVKPRSDASEIGVIRVFSKPGPDAEDRLRRLFTLLARYATQEGQAEKQDGNCTPDEQGPDDPAIGEA